MADHAHSRSRVVHRILLAAIAVVALVTALLCGVAVDRGGSKPAATSTATALTGAGDSPAAAVSPRAAGNALTAGTWEVGTEAKPGTWTTVASGDCYWARLSGFDGDLGSIIANANVGVGDRGRFTIKASDKGVELSGPCIWSRAK